MTPIPPAPDYQELERVRPPREPLYFRLEARPAVRSWQCRNCGQWYSYAATSCECGVPLSVVEGPQPVVLMGFTIGIGEMS